MKRKIIFLISTVILFSCALEKKYKPIKVETNNNIETLMICFELADKGFWNVPFQDYQPMKYLARERFEKYRDHRVIHDVNSLVEKGFWLDAMIEVVLKSSPFPNAELQYELERSTLARLSDNNEEAASIINGFIHSLNDFYEEANLSGYFLENKKYFDSVNDEVRKNLPDTRFITTMESYYGKQNDSYTMIPSPTMWYTAGLGLRIKGNTGFHVYEIFGPLIVTKDSAEFGYGYNNPDMINELSVHEFGHSFINPVVELPDIRAIIDQYEYLLEPIRERMKVQAYDNWRACVTEHLVRLGEIRIWYALGDSSRADKIRNEYTNARSFIYLPHLEKNIVSYETNRNMYPAIDDYVPVLLKSFGEVDTLDPGRI